MLRAQIKPIVLKRVQCDITQRDVKAIVNAANESPLGDCGVDGAIDSTTEPDLLKETCVVWRPQTGDATISK